MLRGDWLACFVIVFVFVLIKILCALIGFSLALFSQ
jgi:hypothetical protein